MGGPDVPLLTFIAREREKIEGVGHTFFSWIAAVTNRCIHYLDILTSTGDDRQNMVATVGYSSICAVKHECKNLFNFFHSAGRMSKKKKNSVCDWPPIPAYCMLMIWSGTWWMPECYNSLVPANNSVISSSLKGLYHRSLSAVLWKFKVREVTKEKKTISFAALEKGTQWDY